MGEYAKHHGEEVKIGTCEDMLYLRADQAHLVTPLHGSTNPASAEEQKAIRFRFPFPDEDGTEPGAFRDPFRGYPLRDVRSPEGVEHDRVQMRSDRGYLLMIPCPEQAAAGVLSLTDGTDHAYKIQYNGYPGPTELIQQAWRGGVLVSVLKCRGCGTVWRLPSLEDAQPVIDALHNQADAMLRNDPRAELDAVRVRSIADRVAAGYKVAVTV